MARISEEGKESLSTWVCEIRRGGRRIRKGLAGAAARAYPFFSSQAPTRVISLYCPRADQERMKEVNLPLWRLWSIGCMERKKIEEGERVEINETQAARISFLLYFSQSDVARLPKRRREWSSLLNNRLFSHSFAIIGIIPWSHLHLLLSFLIRSRSENNNWVVDSGAGEGKIRAS